MAKIDPNSDYYSELSQFTIESDVDAILWIDAESTIYRVNQAACQLLQYSPEELVGKNIDDLIDIQSDWNKTDPYHFLDQIDIIKQNGVAVIERNFRTKDDRILTLEISAHLFVFKNNEYICVFARDITERRKAQEELQKTLKELEFLKNKLYEENIYLQNEIKLTHNFEEIVGKSLSLRKVLEKVEQVAATDATVLIQGETGTGKELIARTIHHISSRSSSPLVKVNCATLPAALIESELFGHEKGAFTGALYRKMGRFELANGGTIFLDEIGDLQLEIQSKLLRVIQEGEFERIGSNKTLKTDVRIIAATNRNLEAAVQKGEFRKDLYYRLNVFPIHVPPLRERPEDIPLLIHHFVQKYSKKIGRKIDIIPAKIMRTLTSYSWPGNIRELENIIERAVIITNGRTLQIGNWFTTDAPVMNKEKIQPLREAERDYILKVLSLTNWRVSGPNGAAQLLDINPQTLVSKMKKLGIHRTKPINE
jgi:PAS domain S-box-containing protein